MEPSTIIIVVGLVTLIVERVFSLTMRIKKSNCCGNEIVMNDDKNNLSPKN